MTRIAVIDALNGETGSSIIKAIKPVIAKTVEIWAMGANANATAQMLNAGAHMGLSGEAAICRYLCEASLIVGPISILICNAFMGEITPRIVEAIGKASAPKILLPENEGSVQVVGSMVQMTPRVLRMLVKEHLAALGIGVRRLV